MKLLLKNLLFALLVPGTVAVYLPLLIAGNHSAGSGPIAWTGLLFVVAGVSVCAWCIWDFARFGRGTPAPIDAPVKLVIRGLYRYTRNPMYVGVLTAILGWAMYFHAAVLLSYGAVVGTCFHLFVVLREEPHLARTFGPEYEAYRARVGRWLSRVG